MPTQRTTRSAPFAFRTLALADFLRASWLGKHPLVPTALVQGDGFAWFGQRLKIQLRGSRPGWRRIPAGITGEKDPMNTTRLIAIALIVAGILGLVYGGFSYTKDTTAVKLGPLELSVKQKETVNVPMWAGIGAIVVGGLLLVLGSKKG